MPHSALQKSESAVHPYLRPTHSSWVSASAGSGKTKILTDRVLSLLLHGVGPEQILCLTFTKAAAAEMRSRVLNQMSAWQYMEADVLHESLSALLGDVPSSELTVRASSLFPLMLEKLHSLKIQTIHSFAQNLLSQFPLEAGIDPHFSILDPLESDGLFSGCVKAELKIVRIEHPKWAEQIALYHDQKSFEEKLRAMMGVKSPELSSLYDFFGLRQGMTKAEFEQAFFKATKICHAELVPASHFILQETLRPVQGDEVFSAEWLYTYQKIFLTADGSIRKRLLPAAFAKKSPETLRFMEDEAVRVQNFVRDRDALDYIAFTEIFFKISKNIQLRFTTLKNQRRVLDYDDLIQKTKELLSQPDVAPWILYKIDEVIAHILVDEAQDTNQAQWQIVEALYDDFFKGQQDQARSVFIVGDQKQSIYGFQGAEPAYFKNAGEKLERATLEGLAGFQQVSLDKSYRSTPAVLKAVDAVFNQTGLKKSIGHDDENLTHHIHRTESPGLVELWPLIAAKPCAKQEGWKLPSDDFSYVDATDVLVETLTRKIKSSLESGFLYDPLRPVEPKDILILLRKRGKLMGKIVNSLKMAGVPVAGADRMTLQDEVAVLDLLNLADFVLLPEDDLALANVLKSPFVSIDEAQLFNLCQQKEKSLWESLEDRSQLENLCTISKKLSVYDFYCHVLFHEKGFEKLIKRLGPECEEVIDAFLSLALTFENIETPSLQGFVLWMRSLSQELKRDTEEGRNQVRIMTIHGSKGLQAPLVFMAETTSPPQQRLPIVVETEAGDKLPARPTINHVKMLETKARHQSAERAEYDRLLYVGMTRAQDQLYLMGIKPHRKSAEGCWYDDVRTALSPLAQSFELDVTEHEGVTWEGEALRLADPVLVEMKNESAEKQEAEKVELPDWVNSVVTLAPSFPEVRASYAQQLEGITVRDLETENALYSSRGSGSLPGAQERGIFLHKLCEILPKVLPEKRHDIAHAYLKNSLVSADLELPELISNLIQMMEETGTKWIFETGFSEVPIKGEIDGEVYDVRLDRLVMRGNIVAIIDFKTTLSDDGAQYGDQLSLYQKLVQELYPDHQIETYILGIRDKKLINMSLS